MIVRASLPHEVRELDSEELARLCSPEETLRQLADVATLHARAVSETKKLKVKLKRRYAVIEKTVRDAARAGGFKLTEAMIEAEVETHKDYVVLEDTYLDAFSEAALLGAMREMLALKARLLRDAAGGEIISSMEAADDDPGNASPYLP